MPTRKTLAGSEILREGTKNSIVACVRENVRVKRARESARSKKLVKIHIDFARGHRTVALKRREPYLRLIRVHGIVLLMMLLLLLRLLLMRMGMDGRYVEVLVAEARRVKCLEARGSHASQTKIRLWNPGRREEKREKKRERGKRGKLKCIHPRNIAFPRLSLVSELSLARKKKLFLLIAL